MITYRELSLAEIERIGEIERRERVTHAYVQHGAELERIEVDWDVPNWALDGEGEHTAATKADAWREPARQGQAFGAFDDGRLVGIGILRYRLEGDMAELAVLHVDCAHRGQGVGRHLSELVFAGARASGATSIYVSASESEHTVLFYQSLGFRPTATPHPGRLAAEPEDIHMVCAL